MNMVQKVRHVAWVHPARTVRGVEAQLTSEARATGRKIAEWGPIVISPKGGHGERYEAYMDVSYTVPDADSEPNIERGSE